MSSSATDAVSGTDLRDVARQLGRPPRGVHSVAHRCPCGQPDVVRTDPRLADGTPFPTTFYATCPRLTGAVSTLEGQGLMRSMQERLGRDPALAADYRRAHEDYLARRAALGLVPEIDGVSAGGMPARVKCLHALVAHALAAGPRVNPLGDEVLGALDPWWEPTSCADAAAEPRMRTVSGAAAHPGTVTVPRAAADAGPGAVPNAAAAPRRGS